MASPLPPYLRRARRLSGFVAITTAMVGMYVAHRRVARAPESRELRDAWVRRWSAALLRLFALEVETIGSLPPAPRAGRLVVANHRSTIDVGLLLGAFGGRMVSRDDLSGWPVVGPAARAVGTVFVDRASSIGGVAAIRTMGRLLRAGETVIVFPEGTTFADDEVRPFLPGAFVAALGAGAEIVPVGIAYGLGSGAAFLDEPFGEHLLRLAGAPPSRVALAIGAPVAVGASGAGRAAAAVADEARVLVQALVARARKRLAAAPHES